MKNFDKNDIDEISRIIGDLLSGSKITTMFSILKLRNFDEQREYDSTKWRRISESICEKINQTHSYQPLYDVVKYVSKPSIWVNKVTEWREFQRSINSIFLFHELELKNNGQIESAISPLTASEATERLNTLTDKLKSLSIHENVFKYARIELLKENYFHAILESSKGVFDRLRDISELNTLDGNKLIDAAFSTKCPRVLIKGNMLEKSSEKSAYHGISSLLKTIAFLYRNPRAHDPKLYDITSIEDTIDAFLIMSTAHRQLDKLINVRDLGTN